MSEIADQSSLFINISIMSQLAIPFWVIIQRPWAYYKANIHLKMIQQFNYIEKYNGKGHSLALEALGIHNTPPTINQKASY